MPSTSSLDGWVQTRLANSRCERCSLRAGCGQVVLGKGPSNAKVLLVETHPGAEEDLEGEPMVGRFSRLLEKILTETNIPASSVYRTYLVKCWPGRTKVRSEHIDECKVWLWRELLAVRPEVVVTFGQKSSGFLLQKTSIKLKDVVGQFHAIRFPKPEIGAIWVAPWFSLETIIKSGRKRLEETTSFFSQVRQRIG